MKVIEHIEAARGPAFSFEIIPPPRGRTVKDLIEVVETLEPFKPMWIDVTSHSASAYFQEDREGVIRRRTYKKRPGSLGICGIIQNRFRIDTVAHVLCLGFSREETEDALIELNYLGVENILAIRGDGLNYDKKYSSGKSQNNYAIDLVSQCNDLRKGEYIDTLVNSEPLDFCVGVAGYPEKHFESANMKTDLMYLKQKVDAGAHYIVTQMFFDNQKFFQFVADCRAVGITVPIIPGLKVLRSLNQLKSIPKTFHVDLPEALADEVMAHPEHCVEIGQRWATSQVHDLINNGHANLHFYVMQDAHVVTKIIETVK